MPLIALFEELLNRAIALDPRALEGLARHSGRVVGVRPSGLGPMIYVSVVGSGLRLGLDGPTPPDALIGGPPLALLRMLRAGQAAPLLLTGQVSIEGDLALVLSLGRLVAGLEIDWEEQLAGRFGDLAAHGLGNRLRALGRLVRDSRDTLRADLREYLLEETRLLARREEVEAFVSGVDTLRDDLARLEQRVSRLRG